MDLHTITAKYTNVFLKRPSTISSLLTVRFVISNAFLWFPTVWTMGFWSVVNLSLLWRFLLVAVYMVPPPPAPAPRMFHGMVPFSSRVTQAKASCLCLLCWSQFIRRHCKRARHPVTTISSHDFRFPRITGRSWASENVIVKILTNPLPPPKNNHGHQSRSLEHHKQYAAFLAPREERK